jgi:hypothetical protein
MADPIKVIGLYRTSAADPKKNKLLKLLEELSHALKPALEPGTRQAGPLRDIFVKVKELGQAAKDIEKTEGEGWFEKQIDEAFPATVTKPKRMPPELDIEVKRYLGTILNPAAVEKLLTSLYEEHGVDKLRQHIRSV